MLASIMTLLSPQPPLPTQVCGDETEEVAVSGVRCRRISAQGGAAAAAEVAVEIEVPLLAAVVELHTEAIASGAAAEH